MAMTTDHKALALREIDDAIVRAGRLMDLADATTEEQQADLYEHRYHCGTCVVRTVLDEVWPAISAYILALTGEEVDKEGGH
jgi:hypothetical protein